MSIESRTSPDRGAPFFNLEEMTRRAKEYTKDSHVSGFIIEILNSPKFWKDPQNYLDRATLRTRKTEQTFWPHDHTLEFWDKYFPKS